MNRTRGSRQRGAVSVLLVVLMSSLFLASGLAYDGGQILAARREAIDVAGAAARAGAQQLDVTALRSGTLTIDNNAAIRSASDYLRAHGYEGNAAVVAGEVHVTVTITRQLAILAAVGISERTVTGIGTARPVRGIR